MTVNTIPVPSSYPASAEMAPAGYAEAVVPADANLGYLTRSLYVGVTGDVVVTMAGSGSIVTFVAVAAGSILPIRVSQVRAATAASGIVALY